MKIKYNKIIILNNKNNYKKEKTKQLMHNTIFHTCWLKPDPVPEPRSPRFPVTHSSPRHDFCGVEYPFGHFGSPVPAVLHPSFVRVFWGFFCISPHRQSMRQGKNKSPLLRISTTCKKPKYQCVSNTILPEYYTQQCNSC